MPQITASDGTTVKSNCISCSLVNGEVKDPYSIIYDGKHFQVRQDFEVPIIGLFVIASKRHIVGFGDFNNAEKSEFIDLLCKLRKGLKKILGIEFTRILHRESVIASKINPSHFHVALMPIDGFGEGKDIGAILVAGKKLKSNEQTIKVKEACEKIKKWLTS